MNFELQSKYRPMGDQPAAIRELSDGIRRGLPAQTLLGVTGSGKTFTMANIVQEVQRPTLVLSHNKTLAAQLYGEFKNFFPKNAVEYFVSYYDYYQPEAYLPTTDTYIEKDLMINDEIERLRLSATSALLSGRSDILVVSSVSCLYGIGNPEDFHANVIPIRVGETVQRNEFLRRLVDSLYSRDEVNFTRGRFRVKGDTIDVYLAYEEMVVRLLFWGDEVERIELLDAADMNRISLVEEFLIYPAKNFVTTKEGIERALRQIELDMWAQRDYFKEIGKPYEAKRIEERTTYDMEMIREVGYCSGIENYSRYFDGREAGSRPFCLLDYFADNFLLIIDESHVTIPQIRAMYGGDFARKKNLVEYGFRLPAAMDNRPLKFDEFESLTTQTLYVSATPADYELNRCEGVVVEQVIRPTGLLDPVISVRPSLYQIDNLVEEIEKRIALNERTLVTTLTKRMAEELSDYLIRHDYKCAYIHSDVDTLDRISILEGLRAGEYDILIGVNLLREGLDLPEVSLVAILDADKEGFLRSHRSLTQTAGRAARNINGLVIMYADVVTESMKKTIDETNRRREKQIRYNEEHGIVPTAITKEIGKMSGLRSSSHDKSSSTEHHYSTGNTSSSPSLAADSKSTYRLSPEALRKAIEEKRRLMTQAAKELDFISAAQLRDQMLALQAKLDETKE